MAGFPDALLPFYWTGKLSFWHYSTILTLSAGAEITFTFGPSVEKTVYLLYVGNTGRPRVVATGDYYTGTGAGLRHQQYGIERYPFDPVKLHSDYLVESVFMPDYPMNIPISHENLMTITLFNTETYNVQWDLTFWILETSMTVFLEEIIPYLRGQIMFNTEVVPRLLKILKKQLGET